MPGSTTSLPRARPNAISACSSCVTAARTPTEKSRTRPVSFAAPRIVDCTGCTEYSPSVDVRIAARSAADPTRVEQAAVAALELIRAGAFDEERALL